MVIAVCDDDEALRSQICSAVKDYAAEKKRTDIFVSAFGSGQELLKSVANGSSYGIYILDILMPDMNGIDLGLQLRQTDPTGKIIYLTSSAEYAIDSYKVKAFQYILKPVRPEELFPILDEVIRSASRQERYLFVKTKNNTTKIAFNEILYATLNRRIISYYLTNGNTLESVSIRTTFTEAMQEVLQDSRFVQCGASMVVNLHHIITIENNAIIFADNSKAFLGVKACRELRSVWFDFWLNKEDTE